MSESETRDGNFRDLEYGSAEEAIAALMSDGQERTPKEVHSLLARRFAWSYKTVANTMADMARRGLLVRVRRGWYRAGISRTPTRGVAGHAPPSPTDLGLSPAPETPEPPRIHDVWITWSPKTPISIPALQREVLVGNTSVRVIFGSKRAKVTVVLANDYPGLDYDGYLLALELALREVESALGVRPPLDELMVVNVQLNRDHRFVRLDGLKSLTVGDFTGIVARWYQKAERVVREEVQPTQKISAEALAAAMSAGLSASQAVQLAYQVLMGFRESQRLLNALLEQGKLQLRMFQALLERLERLEGGGGGR